MSEEPDPPWLDSDPLAGEEVFGVPTAMRCYFEDCKGSWCSPGECLRAAELARRDAAA